MATAGDPAVSLLTVVIPAKDEAANIVEVVRAARPYAAEVLVVDGSSPDGTGRLAAEAGARVITDPGRGKGEAIRLAVPHIRTEITVLLDADGSHDPKDIPRLVAPILRGEADHVTGSRLLGGSSELHGGFDEWARLAGSSFITACINWRYGVRLSDSQNGFRALRTELLQRLPLRARGTTIEQEMIVATLRLGRSMAEVPAHEYPRRFGRSHVSVWRDGWKYVLSLLKLLI
jgi:glycosyltransferase involved in cell wall biosynthesis